MTPEAWDTLRQLLLLLVVGGVGTAVTPLSPNVNLPNGWRELAERVAR